MQGLTCRIYRFQAGFQVELGHGALPLSDVKQGGKGSL